LALTSEFNTTPGGVAVKGYDVVSYFTDKKAMPGKPEFAYQYKGATWYFTSQDNLQLFKSSPETYSPQYGGYCAYAASLGQLADINAKSWTIKNNRLYLNYSNKVRKLWQQDSDSYIQDADTLWKDIKR
jgi:YHS domain-containing protein